MRLSVWVYMQPQPSGSILSKCIFTIIYMHTNMHHSKCVSDQMGGIRAHTHTHGWYQMRQLGTSPYKHAVPASSPHSATQIHGESEPWTNSRSRYSLFPWRWYHKCTGNISVVAIVKPETTDIPFFTEATHRSLMLWTDASILLTLTDVRTSELLQVHALRTAAKSSDRARSRFGKTPHWIELIES